MRLRCLAALGVLLFLAGCGGGGGSTTGPTGGTTAPPPTTQPPGFSVSGFVFYDEDGNGALSQGEDIRIPNATIDIGGHSGTSDTNGRFTVDNVPEGAQTAVAERSSLPSYYEPGAGQAVSVPQGGGQDVAIPVTLDIGRNHPNLYMAFGDSITEGDGSSNGEGYLDWLTFLLTDYFGRADIANEGAAGTKSYQGAERMGLSLNRVHPAFTLIMYGTNDWNHVECKNVVGEPCYTVDSLRNMIGLVRSVKSMPILATIPPVNPADPLHSPPERQQWVADTNDLIRQMAASENTILADVYADMTNAGVPIESLFSDHVHPNDDGYQIIARSFFRALTDSSLRTTSAPVFAFSPGGTSYP